MYRAVLITMTLVALAACERTAVPEAPAGADAGTPALPDREFDTVHSWLKSGDSQKPARAPAPRGVTDVPPVEDLIHGLEQRLENDPDDRKGWSLLARSYAYVGRLGDARRAAANAVMLGDDAEALERQIAAAHEGAL